MTIRVYRNRVVRIPIHHDWLFHAAEFAAEYEKSRAKPGSSRWAETWWLCTNAFVWYYGGEFQPLVDRALATGWIPSEVLKIGEESFHLCTTQVHEKWCFGSTVSGTIPRGVLERSGATTIVLSVLNVPDVDVVGWFPREEAGRFAEGKRYVFPEGKSRPMEESRNLSRRDTRRWLM